MCTEAPLWETLEHKERAQRASTQMALAEEREKGEKMVSTSSPAWQDTKGEHGRWHMLERTKKKHPWAFARQREKGGAYQPSPQTDTLK